MGKEVRYGTKGARGAAEGGQGRHRLGREGIRHHAETRSFAYVHNVVYCVGSAE